MSNTHIVEVDSRLDASNAPEFKKTIVALLEQDYDNLIISFSETQFLDSAGLGALVSVLKSASQFKKRVVLTQLTDQVKQIFELTKLYRLFEIYETLDEAKNGVEA